MPTPTTSSEHGYLYLEEWIKATLNLSFLRWQALVNSFLVLILCFQLLHLIDLSPKFTTMTQDFSDVLSIHLSTLVPPHMIQSYLLTFWIILPVLFPLGYWIYWTSSFATHQDSMLLMIRWSSVLLLAFGFMHLASAFISIKLQLGLFLLEYALGALTYSYGYPILRWYYREFQHVGIIGYLSHSTRQTLLEKSFVEILTDLSLCDQLVQLYPLVFLHQLNPQERRLALHQLSRGTRRQVQKKGVIHVLPKLIQRLLLPPKTQQSRHECHRLSPTVSFGFNFGTRNLMKKPHSPHRITGTDTLQDVNPEDASLNHRSLPLSQSLSSSPRGPQPSTRERMDPDIVHSRILSRVIKSSVNSLAFYFQSSPKWNRLTRISSIYILYQLVFGSNAQRQFVKKICQALATISASSVVGTSLGLRLFRLYQVSNNATSWSAVIQKMLLTRGPHDQVSRRLQFPTAATTKHLITSEQKMLKWTAVTLALILAWKRLGRV